MCANMASEWISGPGAKVEVKNGGGEFDHIGKNRLGVGLLGEFFPGVAAGGDEVGVLDADDAGGLEVEGGIADEGGLVGGGMEEAEDVLGEVAVGLAEAFGAFAALDGVKKGVDAEVFADLAAEVVLLVGEDGKLVIGLGGEVLEEFPGAGEEAEAEGVFLADDGVEVDDGFLGEGVAEEAAHRHGEGTADGSLDGLKGGGFEAESFLGFPVGVVDGLEMVDKGAVEVEEDGGHWGGEWWVVSGGW